MSTLQERVEALEADRQGKAKRIISHPLFSQQQPLPPDQAAAAQEKQEKSDPQQVIVDAVVKALAGHFAKKAVTQVQKGSSVNRIVAAHQRKKKPSSAGTV